jgi:hypothetical protein
MLPALAKIMNTIAIAQPKCRKPTLTRNNNYRILLTDTFLADTCHLEKTAVNGGA